MVPSLGPFHFRLAAGLCCVYYIPCQGPDPFSLSFFSAFSRPLLSLFTAPLLPVDPRARASAYCAAAISASAMYRNSFSKMKMGCVSDRVYCLSGGISCISQQPVSVCVRSTCIKLLFLGSHLDRYFSDASSTYACSLHRSHRVCNFSPLSLSLCVCVLSSTPTRTAFWCVCVCAGGEVVLTKAKAELCIVLRTTRR